MQMGNIILIYKNDWFWENNNIYILINVDWKVKK
jgi:hypothetical protein